MFQEVLSTLLERRDLFINLLIEHLIISSIVIVIAIAIGGAIGIFISEYRSTANAVLSIVNFLYTIPSISMLGFLIPLFGVGNVAAIIALTIYAMLPMVRNTYVGLTQINKGFLEAAFVLGLSPRRTMFRIKLPLAMPIIMSGIRSMVIMTVSLAGIASFIGAGGLGVAIYRGITTNNAAMTLIGSLLIAMMSLILDAIFGLIEKSLQYNEPQTATSRLTWKFSIAAIVLIVIGSLISSTSRNNVVHVATKPMTEQYIMGEMLKLLIERDTDLNVEITSGVGGGTSNIMPAMISGDFDLYPEYTGTAWNMVLKRDSVYNETMFDELRAAYHENYQMSWHEMYGFNNTYGLVVRREIADRYGLSKFSDLSRVADQLTFGAEYDFFEREDGYKSLCQTYQLNFAKTMDLDIGLKYKALDNDQIDVMIVFTTDGQLSQADAVVLADDKNFFPSYRCGNVVREKILIEHPELDAALSKIANTISDLEMSQMNYLVEVEGREPNRVARDFLIAKGLID